MPFQKVSLRNVMFVSLYIVHASVTSRTLHFTWLLCESDRCSSIHGIVSSSIVCECQMMQPLMYCTVSETPSSPSPSIGPVPTRAQPKGVVASSTGEESISVCWMALVLCECCVCVCLCRCVWVCILTWCSILPVEVLLEKS